jgi:hypothetical protein
MEKGVNVFGLTGDGIVHLASYGRVVVDRLDKMGIHGSPRIIAKASEMRAPANNGLRRRRLRDQHGHPRKGYLVSLRIKANEGSCEQWLEEEKD